MYREAKKPTAHGCEPWANTRRRVAGHQLNTHYTENALNCQPPPPELRDRDFAAYWRARRCYLLDQARAYNAGGR